MERYATLGTWHWRVLFSMTALNRFLCTFYTQKYSSPFQYVGGSKPIRKSTNHKTLIVLPHKNSSLAINLIPLISNITHTRTTHVVNKYFPVSLEIEFHGIEIRLLIICCVYSSYFDYFIRLYHIHVLYTMTCYRIDTAVKK